MPIETPIAGHYSSTYNGTALSFTRQGWELQQDNFCEEVNETDAYGQSPIELVYRGGRVMIQGDCKIYKAGTIAPFWPWGAMGVMFTSLAPIARLGSAVAKSLVLTATAATPAATTPATLTGSLAILAPNNNLKLLFNSKVREVPLRFLLLPSETGGTGTWFTTT